MTCPCCGQEELREYVLPRQRPVGYVEAWFMYQFTIHPDSQDDLERRVRNLAQNLPNPLPQSTMLHLLQCLTTTPARHVNEPDTHACPAEGQAHRAGHFCCMSS